MANDAKTPVSDSGKPKHDSGADATGPGMDGSEPADGAAPADRRLYAHHWVRRLRSREPVREGIAHGDDGDMRRPGRRRKRV